MSQPTTSVLFSKTTPAAPDGFVNTTPQSDGATPQQRISEYVAKVGGVSTKTANYTAVAGDNGTLLVFNSSSAITLTLPAAPPMAIWKIAVQNIGAGVLTISRNGLNIDGAATNLTLNQGTGVEIYTDGTNYFTERGAAPASVLTTKGDLLTHSTSDVRLPVGSDGQVLTADSTQTDGVKWGTLPSSSLFFGQGDAVASSGNNTITLGSTPLAGSISVYVLGSILRPSTAWTISGAVITLTTGLSSSNVIVVTWVTTNATPGGITLSTIGSPPIGSWAMGEGSGLTLHDTSGNSNDATINTGSSVTWQSNSGLPGTTPKWNASGYALATSTSLTDFDGTTPFSVGVWVNPTLIPSGGCCFLGTLNATAGTYKGWELQVNTFSPATPRFYLINSYSSNCLVVDGTGTTNLDNTGIHYVVVTYDGSQTSAGVKIYVDGLLQTQSVEFSSLTGSTANGLPLRFGARNDGTCEMKGPMAFAEIWNFVLSSTQVSNNYAAGPAIY